MRERTMMSDDPKDPRWRFRVVQRENSGLVEIVEEELSSPAPSAQVTEVTARLIMTPRQAVWMAAALSALAVPSLSPLPEVPDTPPGTPHDF